MHCKKCSTYDLQIMIKNLDEFLIHSNISLLMEGFPYTNGLTKEDLVKLKASVLPTSEKIKRIADLLD